jgi:hypothetical protein
MLVPEQHINNYLMQIIELPVTLVCANSLNPEGKIMPWAVYEDVEAGSATPWWIRFQAR